MNTEFEHVVQSESQRLYGLCFRLTGRAEEAEDLCQEVFALAYKSFDRFERRSHVSTWLYRIALNAWNNKHRNKNKIKWFGFFQTDEDSTMNDPAGNDPAPGDAMEKNDSQHLLHEGLSTLSPEEKEIIVLRDLEDKSYEELAGLLGIPMGTVKSRLARARESLRMKLVPLLKARGELA